MDNFKINGEFGFELGVTIPTLYSYYKKGIEFSTSSHKDTKHLYYFSKEHIEHSEFRKPNIHVFKNNNPFFDVNSPSIHADLPKNMEKSNWEAPPYKEVYKNKRFVFDKPICLISNKFNEEWYNYPINFINVSTLSKIFDLLKDKYQIIYNRPLGSNIVTDNSRIYNLGDFRLIKDKYASDVILLQDLKSDDITYNELQMMICSNTEHFISVQGGNSVLTSYFGGTNIIFAKKGPELEGAYYTWFKDLSDCKIKIATDYQALLKIIKNHYT